MLEVWITTTHAGTAVSAVRRHKARPSARPIHFGSFVPTESGPLKPSFGLRKARHVARWEAQKEIEAPERGRKRYEEEEKQKVHVLEHPESKLVRSDGRLSDVQRPKEDAPQKEVASKTENASRQEPVSQPQPSAPEPGTPESAAQVRERLAAMIRKACRNCWL